MEFNFDEYKDLIPKQLTVEKAVAQLKLMDDLLDNDISELRRIIEDYGNGR